MQRKIHGTPSGFAQHNGKLYDVRQAIADRRAALMNEINQDVERRITRRSMSTDDGLDDDEDVVQRITNNDAATDDNQTAKEPNKTEEQQNKKPNDQSTNVVEQDSQTTSQVGNVIKKVRKTPTLDELGSNVSVVLENMYNGFKAGRVSEDAITSFIDRIADPKRHQNNKSIIGTANEAVNRALGISDDINKLRNDGALDALRSFIETVDDDVKTSIQSGGINGAIRAASLNRLANKAKVATSSVAGNVDLSNATKSASRDEAAAAIDDIHSRAKFAEDEINSVCEQYGIRDYQSLIDTYNNLDKPMRDRNGNMLPSINEAISNIHRAKDEFDGITSGEIQLPANVDKEAYLKELKRVGAANLEYIANASQQFGSYQNVMSFKSAFDKIQTTRAEDERAMDVYNQVYGGIFKSDGDKIKRSQEGASTEITFQTPGEIPTSTAQYMNRAANDPTFGLKDGAVVNNNIARLYAYRADATNPLIKYYNAQITKSGIAREKERVMQQKAENNNIRLKQFAKTRGIPVDQLSDREKYYATHFDFDETPNWFETVAVSSFNGDRAINGVDRNNDIGEVKQSDLDASYTESEALNRQIEYLDKADILSNDDSTLSKIGSSIKNYTWDHLSTFASNSLLFGAQKYWDEGVGEIITKQNRGEALSYSEKRALEAEYNKQRLLSYGESLKNNNIANMDGINMYDLTNAGVDMLQFSLPIVGVNWLGRGVTFLGKGIRAANTAKNASEGISKGAKIWNATRNVTGYTVEAAGRTLSMDLYDPAKRLTYKSLVKAGAAKAAPTATRAAGVAAGSMAHMGSIIGGTAVEANTIGLGMWKEEFNRYAAGYIYAQKNAEGDIEYGRVSMKDAFGNDIDTEEEYDRMATNQVLGEFGSEKTGLYFDKIMSAVLKKSGFSFLSKNMFANIARKLSRVTGGTTTGYIGEGLEEVLNNTWGGFTGLMKWDEVTDPGQNLQMASHLLVAMLQQGVVVSALGSVKDKASIYRMTNRQINEARDILKEQFLKANANNPEAEKIFNQKYEDAVQLIKQNIKTSQSLISDNTNITDENKDYGFGTKELLELFGLNKDKSEFTPEDKVMMSALSQFVGVYTVGHMSNEALSNTIINNLTTVKGRGWNQLIASTGGRLRKNNRGRTHTLIIPDENGNDIDTGIEFSVDRNGNATPVNTDDAKSGLALNLGSVFINKKDGTYKSFNDETRKKLKSYRDYFITQRNALVKNAFIYQTLAKTGRLNGVLSKVDDYVESNKVSLIRAKIGNFFNPDKYEKFNKYNDSEYINASQADKEALRHMQSEAQYVKNFASAAAVAIQNDKFDSLFKAMGAETEFEKQALLANIFANERLKDMYSHDMFVARSSIAERIFGDEAISDTVDEIYKSIVDEAKQLLPTASDTEIGRLNELINGLNGSSDEKIKSAIKSIIVDRLLQSRSLANLYGGLGFMQMMRAQLDGKAKDKLKYMGFPVFDKIEFNLDSAIDNLIKRAVKNDKSDVKYADLVAQYANAYVNDAIIRGSMTGDKSLNDVLSELYKSGFITDADIMSSAKTRMKSMFRASEESVETFADFINELARDLGYTRDNKNEEGELSLLYNKVLSSSFDSSLGLTRETILKVFNEIDLDKVNDDVAKLIRLVRDNLKEGAEHYNTTLDTVDKFVRNLGDNIDRINKEQADHNKAVLDKMVRQATRFNNTIESDNIVDHSDPSAEPSGDVETGDDSGIPVIPPAGRTDTGDEEGGDNGDGEGGGEGDDRNSGDTDKDKERNGGEGDNDPGDGGDNSLSDELFAKTNLRNVIVTDESSNISSINADEMDKFIESLLSNFGINPANIGDPNYTDAVNKANGIYDLVLAYIRSFDYGSETADSIIDTMEKSILSNLNLTIPKIFNSAIVGTNEDELFKTDMTKTHLGTFMYYTADTEEAFTSYFKKNKSLNKDDVKLTLFRLDSGAEVEVSLDDIKMALNRIKQALNEMSGITSRSIEDGSATALFNKLLDASTEINIGVSVLQDGKLIKIGDLYGGILRQLASEDKANTVKEYENDPSEVINLAHDRKRLLESIVNALEDAISLNSSVTEEESVKNIGVSDLRMYFPTLDGDKEPSNSDGSPIGVGVIDMNANNVYMPGDASYDSKQTVFKSIDGNTQFTMNSVKIGRQEFAVRLKSEGEGYDTVVFNGSNIGMFNRIDPTDRDANRANAIKFVKHLMTLFNSADRDWFNESLEYLNRFILVENLHEDLASIRDAYEKKLESGANKNDVITVVFNGESKELSLEEARKILDNNSYGASIEIIPNMNRDDSAKSGLSKSLDFVVHYIDDEDGSRRTFTARFDENTINKIVNDFDNSNIDDRIANMAIDLYTAVTTRMAFNLNKGNFTSDGTINKINSRRAPYDTESGIISFIPGIFEFDTNDYDGYDSASKLTIAQMMQRSGAFVCGAKLDGSGHVQKSSIPKVYVVSGSCNLKFTGQAVNSNVISLDGINGGEKQTPTNNAPANLPTRPESADAQTETLNKLNDIDSDYSSVCSEYPGSKFGITSVSAGVANKTGDAANNAGGSMKHIGTIMDSIYRIVIEDIIGDSGVYSKNPTKDDILSILTDGKGINAFVKSLFNNKSQKLVADSIKYIADTSGMSRYDMVKVALKNYIAGAISAGSQDLESDFLPYIKTVTADERILSVTLSELDDDFYNMISDQVSEFAQQISDNISNILAGAGVEFGDIIKISDARCVTEKDEFGHTEKVLYEYKDDRRKRSTYDGPKVLLELTKESIGAKGRTSMPDRMLIHGEADIIIVKKDGTTIVSDFKVIAGNDTDETLTSNISEASKNSDGKYFNQLNIERLGLEQKGINVLDESMSIIATEVAPITIGAGVVSFKLRSNNDNKPRIIIVPNDNPKVNIDGQVFEISNVEPPVKTVDSVDDYDDDNDNDNGDDFNLKPTGSFGSGSSINYRAKASYSLNDNPVDLAIVKTDEYGRSYIDIEDAISYIRSTDSIKYSILKRIVNAAIRNGVSRIDITDMMKAFGSVRVRRDGSLVDVKLSIDRDALRDKDCFANTILHELIHAALIGIDTLSASSSASDLYSKYIDYMNQSDSVKAASIKQIITNFDEFLAEGGNDYALGSFVEWAKANNVQLFGGNSTLSKVCNALISLIDKIFEYLGVSNLSTRLAKKVIMYEVLRFIDTNRDGSAKNNVAEGITIINRSNNNQIIDGKAVIPFAILDGTNVKVGLANVLGIDSYDNNWFTRNSEKIRQSAFLSSILSVYRTTSNIESLRSRLIGRDGNGLMKAIDDAINGEEISNKSAARVIKLLDTYLTVCGFYKQSNGTLVNYAGELEAALDAVFKAVNESGDKKPASVLKAILNNDSLKSVAKEMSSAIHAIAENSAQDGNLEKAALKGDFDGMISINDGLSITERFKDEPHFDVHTLDVMQNITSSIGGIYSSYKNFKTRSDIALAIKSICSPVLKDMYFGGSLEFSITASRIIQIIDEQAKVVLDRVTSSKDGYSYFDIKILENLADVRNNILSGDEYTKQIVIDAIADIESKITVIRDEHRADTLQDVIQYSEKDIDPMLSMSPRLKLLLSLIPNVRIGLSTSLVYNSDTGMPEMWDTEKIYRILSNVLSNERTSGAPGFSTFDDFIDNLCRTFERMNTDHETDSAVLGMLFMIRNSTFFDSLNYELRDRIERKTGFPHGDAYKAYAAKNSSYKMREQDLALMLSFMNRDILESENISVAKGGVVSRSSGSGNFTKNTVKIANDNALQMLLVEVGKVNPSIREYNPSDAQCMLEIRKVLDGIEPLLSTNLSIDALYDSLVKLGFVSVNKSDITQATSSNFKTILGKSISLIRYALNKDEDLAKTTTDDIDQTDLYMSAPYRRDLYDANGKFKKPRKSTDRIRFYQNQNVGQMQSALSSIGKGRAMMSTASTRNAKGERIQLDKASNFIESHFRKVKRDVVVGANGKTKTVTDEYKRNFDCEVSLSTGGNLANSIYEYIANLEIGHGGPMEDSRAGSTTKKNDYADRNAIDLMCSKFKSILNGYVPLPTMSSNGYCEEIRDARGFYGRRSFLYSLLNDSGVGISIGSRGYRELAKRALIEVASARRESEIAASIIKNKKGSSDSYKGYHYVDDDKKGRLIGPCATLPRFGSIYFTMDHDLGRKYNGKTVYDKKIHKLDLNKIINSIINSSLDINAQTEMLNKVYDLAYAVYSSSVLTTNSNDDTIASIDNAVKSITEDSRFNGIVDSVDTQLTQLNDFVSKSPRGEKDNTGLAVNVNIFKTLLRLLADEDLNTLVRNGAVTIDESGQVSLNAKLPDLDSEVPVNINGEVLNISVQDMMNDPSTAGTGGLLGLKKYLDIVELFGLIGLVDFENFFASQPNMFKNQVDQTKRYQSYMSTGTEPCVIEFNDDINRTDDNDDSDLGGIRAMHKELSSTEFKYASMKDVAVGETDNGVFNTVIDVDHTNEKGKYLRMTMRDAFRQYAENLYSGVKNEKHRNELVGSFVKIRMDKLSGDSIASSDGACFITMAGLRKYLIKEGRWSADRIDEFFKAVNDGTAMSRPELREMYINIVLSPMKLIYTGMTQGARVEAEPSNPDEEGNTIRRDSGATKVRVMKMAVFPLLPSMLKEGTVGARLAKIAEDSGAELIGDNEIEKVGGLDSQTLFEQSEKEINGANGAVVVDKNVGKDVVKIPTISINAQFLRRQMETNPHEDDIRKLGTQMMFQTISDLCDTDEDGKPIDTTIRVRDNSSTDGKYVERSGREMVDGIFKKMNNLEKAECRKILDSWVTTVNGVETISVSKLKAILESTAIEHALGSDVISEIKRLGGEEYVPLSMLVRSPLFQAKIMAIVRNSAQSLSSNGGSFIQVPQTIFRAIGDNSTRLELVNEHGSMDCIISINAFKSILDTVDWAKYRSDNGVDPNEYGNKYNDPRFYTFDEAKKFLTENNIIGRSAKPISVGYRIPTQSKASISSLRVMDVVGAECGDMIVMPDGYVNITGSDFDIDKLYVATKSFTVIQDADGKQVVVPIKTYLDKLIKSNETASPDKIKQIQIEINKIEALSIASDIIDDYLSIITSPDQFVDTHTTIDSGTKLFKDPDTGLIKRLNTTFTGGKFRVSLISVVNKETGETKEETAESSVYENSISYQINKKLENAGAKFGIGPFAKASVNHVLAQIAGLKLSKEAAALLDVKSLGRIKSRDNVKISDWISYFINAHVDAAKDPYILDFNINKTTWSAACLMLRAGFGEQTLYVLSQESIRTFAMANELASACAVSDDRVRQSKSVRRDNLINEYISRKIEGILNTFYSINKKTGSYYVNDNINIPEDMRLILDHMFTTYNEEGEAINGLFTKKGKYWAIDNKFVKNNQEVASKIFNIFLGNSEPSYIEKNGKVYFANNSTRLLQAMSDISTSGKSSIEYESDSNGNKSMMTRGFNDVYQLALLVAFQSVNSIGKSLDTVVNTCQVEQGGTGTNYYEFKRYLDGISDAVNKSSDDIENVTDMYRKTHLLDKILDISGVTTKIMAGTSVAATPNALALYENVLAVTGNKFNYGRRVSNGIFSAIENESLIRAFNIDQDKVRLALGATINGGSKFDLRLEFNKLKSMQGITLSQNYGLTDDEINALSNLYVGGVIVNGVNVPVMSKSSIDMQVSEIELIKSALDKLYRNKKTKALVENIVLNSLYTEGLIQSGSGVFNILCPWCAYILKDLTLKDGKKTNLKTVSERQMDIAQYNRSGDRMFGIKAGVYRFILKYGFINDLIYRHTHDGKDWSVPFEMNKPFVINGKIRYESLPTMFTSTDSELRSKMFVKMSNKGRTKLYMKMLVYNRGSEIPTPTKEKADISSIEDGIPERRITFKDRKDSKSKSETYVFVEVPADYSRNGASVVQNTSIVSSNQRNVNLRDRFEKVINSTGEDLIKAVMEYIEYLSNEFKNDVDSVVKNTTVAADDPELKYLNAILEWSNENKKLMPLATKIKNADKTNVNSFFSIEYDGDSMSIPYGGNSNIDTSTGYDGLISKFADIYIKNLMPNGVVYKGKKETIQDMYMTLSSILNTMARGNIEVSDSSPFVNGSVIKALNDVSDFVSSVYADVDVDIDMCDNIYTTVKAIEKKCSEIVAKYTEENCL